MNQDEKESKDEKIGDILKRVVSTGISAAFTTEDTVKNLLQELSLPKEIAQGLVQNAKNSKEEFIKSLKHELKEYLGNVDLSKEVDRVIEEYDIEFTTKIKLTPKKKKNESRSKKS